MQQGALSVVDSMEQTRGKTGDQKVIRLFILFYFIFEAESVYFSVSCDISCVLWN